MAVSLGERAGSLRTGAGQAARTDARQLSIVVPVYNEGAGLNILHAKLTAVVK